jgi:CBS domain-containing protein
LADQLRATSEPSGQVSARQRPGFVAGLEAAWRFAPRVGAGIVFAHASSPIRTRFTGPRPETTTSREDGRVLAAAALLHGYAPTLGGRLMFTGALGPALVSRGGGAYRGVEGTRDVGAALQAGADIRLARRVGLRVTARDFVYRAGFRIGSGTTPTRTQQDLVLSAGFAFTP